MNVPFFGLDRQYREHRERFLAITDEVLSTGQVLQGKPVLELEEALKSSTGRRYAVALGSCTDALAFSLTALGIGPGHEVLVTAFSFVASASPILRVGATPRFVDIDPRTYMMDLGQVEQAITRRTRAIIAVHLYGQALAMADVEALAARHGLELIEDGAQGIGSAHDGRPVGSMGRVSCLSFDPTKVIGSFSSAGAVVTDDEEVARKIAMQRYHGRDPATREYEMLGYNSQLSSEMAAMLVFKLSLLRRWEQRRGEIASIYREGLADLEQQVQLPHLAPKSTHNWHKFVVRVSDRDRLARALQAEGIQTMVHYPVALPDTPLFRAGGGEAKVPNARQAAGAVLSLPIYPELTDAEASYVVEKIREQYVT